MMILRSWDEILQHLEPEITSISCSSTSRLKYHSSGVSKIIHQSWKNQVIPEHWESSYLSWTKYHPDFIYILWDDEMNRTLVKTFYPAFLHQYDSYPHNIQRADFSRICYLHRYGGVYSDLDIEPRQNCEELMDLSPGQEVALIKDAGEFNHHIKEYITGKGNYASRMIGYFAKKMARYTNMFMISIPRAEFWFHVLAESKLRREVKSKPLFYSMRHFEIMWATGPLLINDVGHSVPHLIKKLDPFKTNPCNICEPYPCTKPDALFVMLPGSSWAEQDSDWITWMSCSGKYWIVGLVLIVIAIIIGLIWWYHRRKSSSS